MDEALATIKEALEILRELCKSNPDVAYPNLAMSLCNQAQFLKRGEHWAAALGPIQEAVEIYRRIYQEYPLVYNELFRLSLFVLEECLWEVGREEEAQKAREEADRILVEP